MGEELVTSRLTVYIVESELLVENYSCQIINKYIIYIIQNMKY